MYIRRIMLIICIHLNSYVITLSDEVIPENEAYEIFDPNSPWKRKTLTNFTVKTLLTPIFRNGKCVYQVPSIVEIRNRCQKEIDKLWDTVLRFENPHKYYVDLSQKLWDLKNDMLYEYSLK